MKIAQSCPYCKEIFIPAKLLEVCPFCEKALPKKAKAASPQKQVAGEMLQRVLTKVTEQPSTDIIKEFVDVREQVQLIYNLVYEFLSKNNELIKSKDLQNAELCDFGFFSRELEKVFDELRKEAKARKELCGQIIAYRLVQASISDPTIKMQVQGQFATGTPDVKMEAALPKKFTDEYYQLTDYFNVPREVAASGILKLDWKQVTEFLTKRMNDGIKIPEGFGKKYPRYTTTYRKKKRD